MLGGGQNESVCGHQDRKDTSVKTYVARPVPRVDLQNGISNTAVVATQPMGGRWGGGLCSHWEGLMGVQHLFLDLVVVTRASP